MPRPPINTISQTELIAELKRWIDAARFSSSGSKSETDALRRLLKIVEENPESSLRRHVLHNIGCGRRAYLKAIATSLPPVPAAAILTKMGCE